MPLVQSPLSKAAATLQQEIPTSPSAPRNDKFVRFVILLTKADNHNYRLAAQLLTLHLRAKSRLRRLRSETRLRTQPGGSWLPGGQTEEECGRKSYGCMRVSGIFNTSDFAVLLPTRLCRATFSPGEGLAPAALDSQNDNFPFITKKRPGFPGRFARII